VDRMDVVQRGFSDIPVLRAIAARFGPSAFFNTILVRLRSSFRNIRDRLHAAGLNTMPRACWYVPTYHCVPSCAKMLAGWLNDLLTPSQGQVKRLDDISSSLRLLLDV